MRNFLLENIKVLFRVSHSEGRLFIFCAFISVSWQMTVSVRSCPVDHPLIIQPFNNEYAVIENVDKLSVLN
jgi:hypothetical protein